MAKGIKSTPEPDSSEKTDGQSKIQWHPAFCAVMQIELKDSMENLITEEEHQLSKKPLDPDILIIKKSAEKPITKNIGRIFRKYNLIEYKSPEDYMSTDDYYKVQGYASILKGTSPTQDAIKYDEITISLISLHYPRKMIRHLTEVRKYHLETVDLGIYYLHGSEFPVQIVVTSQLDKTENLWLHALTDNLCEQDVIPRLLTEYERNHKNTLYESAMDVIVKANKEILIKEEPSMCQALKELYEEMYGDEIRKKMDAEIAAAKVAAEATGEARGEARGEVDGALRKAQKTAFNMKKSGFSDAVIADILEVAVSVVQQWLAGAAPVK